MLQHFSVTEFHNMSGRCIDIDAKSAGCVLTEVDKPVIPTLAKHGRGELLVAAHRWQCSRFQGSVIKRQYFCSRALKCDARNRPIGTMTSGVEGLTFVEATVHDGAVHHIP